MENVMFVVSSWLVLYNITSFAATELASHTEIYHQFHVRQYVTTENHSSANHETNILNQIYNVSYPI